MEIFNSPNILDGKTNEQNIKATLNYLSDMADTLNVYLTDYLNRIEALEKEVKNLKKGDK